MAYVICKHPAVRIDLLAKKDFWPKIEWALQKHQCTYKKMEETDRGNGDKWIKLSDVESNWGYGLGSLLRTFYSLEHDESQKFYILIKPRMRGRKPYDSKDRTEIGTGSEG